MDVQRHLSTWTRIRKRKNKAKACVTEHYFPIAFQNFPWLRTETSLAKTQPECCARSSAWRRWSCWSHAGLSRSPSELRGCAAAVGAIGGWRTGGTQCGLHLEKNLTFWRKSITEQMDWEEQSRRNAFVAYLKPTVSSGTRSRAHGGCTRQGAVCLHPLPAPHLLPPGCWKCNCSHSQATCPAKSTKNQTFPSTWPLAIPCAVTWNTEFTLLFTKLKTQSKVFSALMTCFPPTRTCKTTQENKDAFSIQESWSTHRATILDFASALQRCSYRKAGINKAWQRSLSVSRTSDIAMAGSGMAVMQICSASRKRTRGEKGK